MVARCPLVLGALAALLSFHSLGAAAEEEEEDGEGDLPAKLDPGMLRKLHTSMDTNADGRVSMDEVKAFSLKVHRNTVMSDVDNIMAELDDDKDKKVSLDELISKSFTGIKSVTDDMKQHEKDKFAAADENQDGFLSRDELPAVFYPVLNDAVLEVATKNMLKSRDLDGDGKVDRKEFMRGDDLGIEEDFDKLDKDGNDKLDWSELKAWEAGSHHTEHEFENGLFALADKDGDKHLSAEELHSARDAIHGTTSHHILSDWSEHVEL